MSNVYDRQLESQAEHIAIKSARKPMSNQMINLINYGNAVMQTIAQKEFEVLLVETQKQGLIPAFIKNNFDNPDDPSELNEFFSYGKGIVSVPDDFKPIDIPAMVKKEAKNAELDEVDLQKAINKKAMQVLHSLDPNNYLIAQYTNHPSFTPLETPYKVVPEGAAFGDKSMIPSYQFDMQRGAVNINFVGSKIIQSDDGENLSALDFTLNDGVYPAYRGKTNNPSHILLAQSPKQAIEIATLMNTQNNKGFDRVWILGVNNPEAATKTIKQLSQALPYTTIVHSHYETFKEGISYMGRVSREIAMDVESRMNNNGQASDFTSTDNWARLASKVVFGHTNLPRIAFMPENPNEQLKQQGEADLASRQQRFQQENPKLNVSMGNINDSTEEAIFEQIVKKIDKEIQSSQNLLLNVKDIQEYTHNNSNQLAQEAQKYQSRTQGFGFR